MVELAGDVAADLHQTLQQAAIPFDVIHESWKLFVLYYAARIYGAFGGGVSLRAHGFDREAQFMERALYEYYTKMLYYTIYQNDALSAVQSFPKQYQRLLDKLKLDISRFMNDEQMTLAEQAIDYNADANFKELRDKLVREPRFTRQAHKPAIKYYLKESRGRWNLHWVMPSQVVHGSLMDVFAASKLDLDSNTITGEMGGLRPQPNSMLLLLCEFAVHTALHIETEFGLSESPSRTPLLQKLILANGAADSMDQFVDNS